MNICELRTSLLEAMGVTVTEVPHEVLGEEPAQMIVITAPRTLMPALTDWLDVTDTGRLVEMTFSADAGADQP